MRSFASKVALGLAVRVFALGKFLAEASGRTGDPSGCTCVPGKADPHCRYEPRIDPINNGMYWQ